MLASDGDFRVGELRPGMWPRLEWAEWRTRAGVLGISLVAAEGALVKWQAAGART